MLPVQNNKNGLSSKSSSDSTHLAALGRVWGHRGATGELTIRVAHGAAAPWVGTVSIWLRSGNGAAVRHRVVESRAYSDRWVVRLSGIDDPSAAAALKGAQVLIDEADASKLPEGTVLIESVIGMLVVDESGVELGRIVDFVPAATVDQFVVERCAADGRATRHLVPHVRAIVLAIDCVSRRVTVRPPEGLFELEA